MRLNDGYNVKMTGMRINKRWMVALLVAVLSGASGCNTISFFPYKAAEKAADKVLDDILPVSYAQDDATKPPEPKER